MDQKTKTNLIFLIVGIVVGGIIMSVVVISNANDRIDAIKEAKEIIVYAPTPLEDLDFQIVSKNRPMFGVEENNEYWNTDDYFIEVFRVGNTYYLKIYRVTEFDGD